MKKSEKLFYVKFPNNPRLKRYLFICHVQQIWNLSNQRQNAISFIVYLRVSSWTDVLLFLFCALLQYISCGDGEILFM